MVTKVVTDQDVDNVTIIINDNNKLACATPSGSGSTAVEIEEIPNTSTVTDRVIAIDGKQYQMSKVGVIKGTEWLVFQLNGFVPVIATPPVTEPPADATEWTPVLYCEQNQANPEYDETYTGVQIKGSLPADVTEVILTLENGDQLQFPVNSTGIYKYNVDPKNYYNYGRIPMFVTPITATSDLERKSVINSGRCLFISAPE